MLSESIYYTQVADSKLIELFKHNEVSDKAIALFSHVLSAQHIWANRILGTAPKYQVWETFSPDVFEQVSKENFELMLLILKDVSMDEEIVYTNSKGDIFNSIVKDILFHVVNHSTYHRGQIATLFKVDGIKAPVTDYIMLKRNHQL